MLSRAEHVEQSGRLELEGAQEGFVGGEAAVEEAGPHGEGFVGEVAL